MGGVTSKCCEWPGLLRLRLPQRATHASVALVGIVSHRRGLYRCDSFGEERDFWPLGGLLQS
jgi:hypothetical protein